MASSRGGTRRPGAATIELAFVAVVLFLFLFGVIEYGRFVMVVQLANNAAREGARAAVTGQSTLTTAQIQGVVNNYLAGQLPGYTTQVYQIDPSTGNNLGAWTSAGFGQAIAVQVNADYTPMLPSFLHLQASFPLQALAIEYSEAN